MIGGGSQRLAEIQTPFILERAKPSKDGDAKLWAFGSPTPDEFYVPMVARLPKGWAGEEPVRPRSCYHLPVTVFARISGSVAPVTQAVASLFSFLLVFSLKPCR
jgi:hypothetical protein